MDQIRDVLMSWRAMDVIDLAREDRDAVVAILNLLCDDDVTVRLRALSAMKEILSGSDEGVRTFVLNHGFESIVNCLTDDDSRVPPRAAGVLSVLLDGVVLDEARFALLLDAVASRAQCEDVLTCISFIDLLKKAEIQSPGEGISMKIRSLASSGSLWARLMGLRVLINLGSLDGYWKSLRDSIEALLSTGNDLLIELALDLLDDSLEFQGTPEMMKELVRFIAILKAAEVNENSVFLRTRMGSVRKKLEDVLLSYYRSRPVEAVEAIGDLLREGRSEDALVLMFIIGRTDLLIRVWVENVEPELIELLKASQTA